MTERKTVVYPNPQVLAEAVAARTLLTIIDLLAEPNRKRVDIAVTGGTDGNRVFAAMNASPLNDAVDWSRVHVWWGDERFVAADDDDRNAKQAREAGTMRLWKRAHAGGEHPCDAGRYPRRRRDRRLPRTDRCGAGRGRRGVPARAHRAVGRKSGIGYRDVRHGPDAHFASLFPDHGEAEIDDPHVLVAGVRDSPKPPPLRLTLTVPMIARSKHTWVFTSEERKAGAVKAAFAQRNNPHAPSSYADGEELLWLIDEGAASKL